MNEFRKIKPVFLLTGCIILFWSCTAKKKFPVYADTLKGLTSSRLSNNPGEEYYFEGKKEFFFPQYFICEAVKKNKLKILSPDSNPWEKKTEFTKKERDSLFVRKRTIWIETDDGNAHDSLIFEEAEGLICDGYNFYEELTSDSLSRKLFFNIAGISLVYPKYVAGTPVETPYFYYSPPNEKGLCSPEFLLMKSQRDSFLLNTFSVEQVKSLNKILMNCITWAAEGKRIIFQNGKPLLKQEALKLREKTNESSLLNGTSELRITEDWYFNPDTYAFQKEVRSLKIISEKGEEVFSFEF